MPPYPGTRQSMEVQGNKKEESNDTKDDTDDWAAQYEAYLEEKELGNEDKVDQKQIDMDNDDEGLEGEDWAAQYAKHCEEKEREFFESKKKKEG